MSATNVRTRTLKIRVSESEYEKILARLPPGTELSAWLRSLALGEARTRTSALALAEHSTGRELAYLAASVDAIAREVATCKPASLPAWLIVLRRIRDAAVELAHRDRGPHAEQPEQENEAAGRDAQ